jgi:hypothetical protein
MITTSFIILKYALTSGPSIVSPTDCESIECGEAMESNSPAADFIPFDDDKIFNWSGASKLQLRIYKNKSWIFYYNYGPKNLQFVPNNPLGRGLALNYITHLEEKKLASMAKQLIIEGNPFHFPWGVGVTKAQEAKLFIITVGNGTVVPESQG